MDEKMPICPKCSSEYVYEDGHMYVCPECGHEWSHEDQLAIEEEGIVRDVNGNILQNGDSVSVVKTIKVKGSSSDLKAGTKIKNIRLVDGPDGHDLEAKVDGIGALYIKSDKVKKL